MTRMSFLRPGVIKTTPTNQPDQDAGNDPTASQTDFSICQFAVMDRQNTAP